MNRNEGETGSTKAGVLDSWKEIASYLGRSVRSVQRWEKEEALPVHRQRHRRSGTVYAYPAEIDAWKVGRERLGATEPEENEWRRGRWRLLGAALLTVGGIAWLLASRSPQVGLDVAQPVLEFEDRDRLLIAGFDNATDEEVLDGTLEAALVRDLRSNGFSSLVSRYRFGDSLQLLGRPVDFRIDTEVAQEIARRDSAVRAVLLGSIEREGSSFVLSLDLFDPVDGVVLARLTEEAPSQEDILPAVARLSGEVRASLGEALPVQRGRGDPGSLSVPSLLALQLFSHADRLFVEGHLGGTWKDGEAEKLLRDAVEEDSDFASAHTHLAWALKRQRGRADEYMPHAETALDLAEEAPIPERYFIRASYYHMRSEDTGKRSDLEEALEQYQALLEIDPGHFWAFENAFGTLPKLGRGQERLELAIRSLAARPNDISSLSRVAQALVAVKGDFEEARPYVERARQLQSELPAGTRPREPFLDFFPVHESWVRGEVEEVVRQVDWIVESVGGRAAAEGKPFALHAIAYYLDLGMFEKAAALQELYAVMPPRAWQFKMGWRRGDGEVVRELDHMRSQSGQAEILALASADLAIFGYLDESEELLGRLPAERPLALGLVSSARGHIALDRGRYDDARAQLEQAGDLLRYGERWTGYYFSSVQALSRAWEALGEPQRAIEVLEKASLDKPRVLDARVWWLQTRLRLAELYREVGRLDEAIGAEEEVRQYCAYADPEFPILRELERQGRVAGG